MNDLKVFSDDLIPVYVTDTGEQVVMGTELHERLEIATPYHKWFPRMTEYGFTEGTDFNPVKNVRVQKEGNREVKREVTDHVLSLDMAKHICMIQRTERGKRIRQKLIELEKQVSTPDSYMIEDPIERAKAWIREQEVRRGLEMKNSQLTVTCETMRPKAEFFDDLVDRNLLTSIRDTAKELKVKEKTFVQFLIEKGYLYRNKKGKLTPYAGKSDGLFEVKETKNEKTKWAGTQTLVTPRGRETFRLLTEGMRYE